MMGPSNVENFSPQIIKQIFKELTTLSESPLEGIRVIYNDNDITNVQADIDGPPGTPYHGGSFRVRIVLESALNEEAGKLLLEFYDDYCRRAKMYTEIHAPRATVCDKKAEEHHSPCSSSSLPTQGAINNNNGAVDKAALDKSSESSGQQQQQQGTKLPLEDCFNDDQPPTKKMNILTTNALTAEQLSSSQQQNQQQQIQQQQHQQQTTNQQKKASSSSQPSSKNRGLKRVLRLRS